MYGQTTLIQNTIARDGFNSRDSFDSARRRAAQCFWSLRFKSTWERIGARIMGRSNALLDLKAYVKENQVLRRRYAGNRNVPIRQIKGSEGRASDFDAAFRPLQSHDQDRWTGVAAAISMGVTLPPVELVQIGDIYFVRDGHHRISVAAAQGQSEVDAQVTMWEI